MPDTGVKFGADLYDLWRSGRDNLPSVAKAFAEANNELADTDIGLHDAFHQPEQFGGPYGLVDAPWRWLRDALQKIMAETAVNLQMTGEALCLAATEYAKTDADAAREFERLRARDGDKPPVAVPAPKY